MTKRIRIRKRINVFIDEGKIFMPPTLNPISSFSFHICECIVGSVFIFSAPYLHTETKTDENECSIMIFIVLYYYHYYFNSF